MSAEFWNYVTNHHLDVFVFVAMCVMFFSCLLLTILFFVFKQNYKCKQQKTESKLFEAERKQQETESKLLEAERKQQEAESKLLEAKRKQQEAESKLLEAKRKQQETEGKLLEAKRKQQEIAQQFQQARKKLFESEKLRFSMVGIPGDEYWKSAISKYEIFRTYDDFNDESKMKRQAIALQIFKMPNKEFTKAELYKQFKQLYKDYIGILPGYDVMKPAKEYILKSIYTELYFSVS